MTVSYLKYGLSGGYIHNWLAAGPQVLPVDISGNESSSVLRQKIAGQYAVPELEIDALPVARGELTDGIFTAGEFQGSWEYTRCLEDHLVNHSGVFPEPCYLRSWAYVQLVCADEMDAQLRLVTPGPADVWINRKHLLRKETFASQAVEKITFTVRLSRGANKIAVRFENLALRGCAHYFALQICDAQGAPLASDGKGEADSQVAVQIPTTIMPRLINLRGRMEKLYASLRLERDVFERDQEVALLFPDDETAAEIVTIRLKTMANVILFDGAVEGKPGMRRRICSAFELGGGRYKVELLPRVAEYYEFNMRVKKDLPLWTVGNAPYSTASYGSYPERRREGLLKAVEQRGSIFTEMAKMALSWWNRVDPEVFHAAAARVRRREPGSILDLAALLGILCRYSQHGDFPHQLLPLIEECALEYSYQSIELDSTGWGQGREAEGFLLSACETIAGQCFPDRQFGADGQDGRWHSERSREQAAAWMHECGLAGFSGWGSSEELARSLVALSLLVDLAADEPLQELAMVMLDKIFFTLAINTFQGILGGAQRFIQPADLRGGILQPTCPVARLMWGAGVFNHRIEALVSLACMDNYELPPIISGIASSVQDEIWNREQHAAGSATESANPVNRVSFRTPDAMLASAQDYRAEQPGAQELVWQAVLGPSAIVFVNHPGSSFTDEGMYPGYWVGNAVLPRVAQWKGSLAAVYDLPADDWMGFTHAYFPAPAFDETVLRDGWAFARKGEGYLALSASTGIEMVTQGEFAYHELRSPGRQVIWICHVGRAALDGDFASFQEKILALPIQFRGLEVEFVTLQGDRLSFGNHKSFLKNGEEIPLDDYPHIENNFTVTPLNSSQMDIVLGEDVLRLDFSNPSGAEPGNKVTQWN